jgi:hypothetical protein
MTLKKETKTKQRKSELEKDIGVAADTVQTGARAVFNKLGDSYSSLKAEYKKEKFKQK